MAAAVVNNKNRTKLTLDMADGSVVRYKHKITGRVKPADTPNVQLLVLSDDDQWYLQQDAVVKKNGQFTIDSTFGYPDSVHGFTMVATAGATKIVDSPLPQVPGSVDLSSESVSVVRVPKKPSVPSLPVKPVPVG